MDAVTLLRHAEIAGLRIEASGERLLVRGPKRAAALVRLLSEHKRDVLVALAATNWAIRRPHAWGETQKEGDAIIGDDGGIPREWREGCARLDRDRSPGDVPPRRWEQFVDDVNRFLNSRLVEKAVLLGWGPIDLFGCDQARPFARIDQAGLCWLIGGNRLVDLSEEAAIIETWTGARQTWKRKPTEPGRVPAWELILFNEPHQTGA
jgi:hypothetical protein